MTEIWLLLIPLALLIGWYFGKRASSSHVTQQSTIPPLDYLVGLNYLLNEQQDKAVDIFIKILEVNSETVEMHLALGNLFRRRGEVDRAIRIHQNLIARPYLSKPHRSQALLALAQDYMRAGLIDRAERLFQEVIDAGEQQVLSFRALLDIYQQQKNWEQAIDIAQKYEAASKEDMSKNIGHYYCELAARSHGHSHSENTRRLLKRALATDKNCVRANLALAEIEMQEKKYKSAIRAYQQVKEQDADFLSETIEAVVKCYRQLSLEKELHEYLWECLHEYPRISIVLVLADSLLHKDGVQAAADFIANHLRQFPSIRGLHRLIELQLQNADSAAQHNLNILHSLTSMLLESKPIYRCIQCGFKGKTLHWQCPGCKGWSTVRPIHGIEGD